MKRTGALGPKNPVLQAGPHPSQWASQSLLESSAPSSRKQQPLGVLERIKDHSCGKPAQAAVNFPVHVQRVRIMT